jgi:phosphate transport system permease protein
MSLDTGRPAAPGTGGSPFAVSGLPSVTLPRWAFWAVGALAAVVAVVSWLAELSPLVAAAAGAVTFVVAQWALSRVVEGPRKAIDRLVRTAVVFAFALAALPLVSVLWTVVENGAARFDAALWTQTMRGVVGEGGGALHAIMGTLVITVAAAIVSVPIGMLTAIYLVEYGGGRLSRMITILVDVMTGIPSIVAGLFAYALFSLFLGPGIRLGIGGAVALSVLMVPIVVRSTEEMLRLVPNSLREASLALGVPRWRTIVSIVLPTAAGGIGAGIVVAIARIIGETAPLLIIAGTTAVLNLNLFQGRMQTLPVFTYYSYTQPGFPPEASINRAWAAALVLMVIVMLINLLARLIARRLSPRAR